MLVIMLVACSNKEEIYEKEYIDPVMDIFLFGELSSDDKKIIKKANGNKDFDNNQFKMLNKEAYDKDLIDIYGNTINFNDYNEYVLEIVSVGCNHCKKMITEHLDDMLNKNVQIIQYFNIGTKEDIEELYKDIDKEIPNNLIIIEENSELEDYIKNILGIDTYPSLISFKNGKVSFNEDGDIESDELDSFFDLSFNENIVDKIDIESLISKVRTLDDVKNSISEENLDRIASIDNDGNTLDYTLRIIGSKVDFDKISHKNETIYVSEIDTYDELKDSDLVLIYTYLKDSQDTNKINFINKLIDSNDSVKYIVVLIEGIDSSSNIYNNMDTKFHTKVVSVLGYIPDDFFKIGIKKYPTAFFIEKGTFTGAYSNIENIEDFNKAIDMFIGDNSVALKVNN